MSQGNSIEEVGGVKKSGGGFSAQMNASRSATEEKMNAELLANKLAAKSVKVDDKQNNTAGSSTNQSDYNKRASDELVSQTGMDGKAVTANGIDTKNQLGQGNQDNNENNSKGQDHQVNQIKLQKLNSSDLEANAFSFPISKGVKNMMNVAQNKNITVTSSLSEAAQNLENEGTLTAATNQMRMAQRLPNDVNTQA